MQSDLLNLCSQARQFLEPRWLLLHQSWGDPQPKTTSEYMCRYTSIFLKAILNVGNCPSWRLVAGRPIAREYEGTQKGCFGFRRSDGLFFDHCWVQSSNLIVDITADQFEDKAIIITPIGDSRYCPNLEEANFYDDITKLSHRPQKWLREWNEDIAELI
ncbi:hypothetical protein [Chamaesiphon minutus]|uniref:Uncharacterized protein n=1 Tax=Chamaesiphon minutus (strain ATCC 27169 / PCC 6605) TaxID=1173020 RepID=K9UH94_CHAP6|nr:hypothetical protein [Chamaesiphon minutus]AFY93584.1 hypothetical protein Cha6605_2533 [Chamaesiphon minutus PCC 6605]